MVRKILDSTKIHSAIASDIGGSADHRSTGDVVEKAITDYTIVVVGIDQNPFPTKARKLLDA